MNCSQGFWDHDEFPQRDGINVRFEEKNYLFFIIYFFDWFTWTDFCHHSSDRKRDILGTGGVHCNVEGGEVTWDFKVWISNQISISNQVSLTTFVSLLSQSYFHDTNLQGATYSWHGVHLWVAQHRGNFKQGYLFSFYSVTRCGNFEQEYFLFLFYRHWGDFQQQPPGGRTRRSSCEVADRPGDQLTIDNRSGDRPIYILMVFQWFCDAKRLTRWPTIFLFSLFSSIFSGMARSLWSYYRSVAHQQTKVKLQNIKNKSTL